MSHTTYISMPQLSDSMEEGTILKWLIADGNEVHVGQELLEIETEKASMTYDAQADGRLQILAAEGATVAVGAPIARITAGQDTLERDRDALRPDAPQPAADVSPPVTTAAVTRSEAVTGLAPGTAVGLATPLARRAARVHDVALEGLSGTGMRGRITRADVLRAAGVRVPPPPAACEGDVPASDGDRRPPEDPPAILAPVVAQSGKGETRRVQPTRQQQLIARRMAESKATIPEFHVQTEVLMDAAIALRSELKSLADQDPPPTFNDIIVKACAVALRRHPQANASYADGVFEMHSGINVGIAVAAGDALVVPVVSNADTKTLGQIARETRQLAEHVRSGQISPLELANGTFTVSNLGMYGMTAITPVINPPQAAILGVAAMRPVLAREAGEIVDRTLVTLTLACDHRILNGADAAELLAEIKDLLEAPLRLAL